MPVRIFPLMLLMPLLFCCFIFLLLLPFCQQLQSFSSFLQWCQLCVYPEGHRSSNSGALIEAKTTPVCSPGNPAWCSHLLAEYLLCGKPRSAVISMNASLERMNLSFREDLIAIIKAYTDCLYIHQLTGANLVSDTSLQDCHISLFFQIK